MTNKFWRFFYNSLQLNFVALAFICKSAFANSQNPTPEIIDAKTPTNSLLTYLQSHAPAVATIFFFLFFCYVVYSVFKKGKEKTFDEYAKIPFKENDNKQNTSQQSKQADYNNKN